MGKTWHARLTTGGVTWPDRNQTSTIFVYEPDRGQMSTCRHTQAEFICAKWFLFLEPIRTSTLLARHGRTNWHIVIVDRPGSWLYFYLRAVRKCESLIQRLANTLQGYSVSVSSSEYLWETTQTRTVIYCIADKKCKWVINYHMCIIKAFRKYCTQSIVYLNLHRIVLCSCIQWHLL
jgi:hypothetical protein